MFVKNNTENIQTYKGEKTKNSILTVVVLYQVDLSDCIALTSFFQAIVESGLADSFKLLIYDNSPTSSTLSNNIPLPYVYIHDSCNGGLVKAYNTALQMAEEDSTEWLQLLDQDTVLTTVYLQELCMNLSGIAKNTRCAALVPRLLSKHRQVSPNRVLSWGRLLSVNSELPGVAPYEITAFNSGVILRVAAMRAIDGFNSIFWLDFLDHWIFNRLHLNNYSVYIMNATLVHDFSLSGMVDVSIPRYKNILLAESEFYLHCKSKIENVFYCFRLLIRAFKRLIMRDERKFFVPTLMQLLNHVNQIRYR